MEIDMDHTTQEQPELSSDAPFGFGAPSSQRLKTVSEAA